MRVLHFNFVFDLARQLFSLVVPDACHDGSAGLSARPTSSASSSFASLTYRSIARDSNRVVMLLIVIHYPVDDHFGLERILRLGRSQ